MRIAQWAEGAAGLVVGDGPGMRLHLIALLPSRLVSARIAHGALWSLAGTVCARVASIGTSIIVARQLGVEQFGEFGIVQGTTALFGTYAGFGLSLTSIKYISEYRETQRAKAGELIFLSTVMAVVFGAATSAALLLAAPWLARHTLAAPQLESILRVSGVALIFNAVAGVQLGILVGLESFKLMGYVNCATNLVLLITVAAGARFGGLIGATWGTVAGSVAGTWITHIALASAIRGAGIVVSRNNLRRHMSIIWSFSVPAVIGSSLIGTASWGSNAILVNTAGFKEMGLFNSANQWRLAMLFLPATVGTALLPVLSNLSGKGDYVELRRVVRLGVFLSVGLAAMIGVPVAVLSGSIMRVYGPGFENGAPVVMLIVLCGLVISINNHLSRMAAGVGHMWLSFRFDLTWALVCLVAAFVLAPRHGAIGLACAYLLAGLVQGGYQMLALAPLTRSLLKIGLSSGGNPCELTPGSG